MPIEIKPQADVPVVPAWIVNEECAKQYLLGRAWYECSTNVLIPWPLTEQYLLDNLKWMSEKDLFNANYDDCAFEHLRLSIRYAESSTVERLRKYLECEPGYLLKRRFSRTHNMSKHVLCMRGVDHEGYLAKRVNKPYRYLKSTGTVGL